MQEFIWLILGIPLIWKYYCGADLAFLCKNDYIKAVKDPFLMNSSWKNYETLMSHLNVPELSHNDVKG